MENYTPWEQVFDTVNKLFVYTDDRQWTKLIEDVFTAEVMFDMSSMGAGVPKMLLSTEICDMWKAGFESIDVVNHLCGNHLINISGNRANAFAYATATHFKNNAQLRKTREFVGTYNIHLILTENGWRIDSFKYNLKYSTGNLELK